MFTDVSLNPLTEMIRIFIPVVLWINKEMFFNPMQNQQLKVLDSCLAAG
jgi:hypothetical protein